MTVDVGQHVPGQDVVGEGPSWDDRTQTLTWVDIRRRLVRTWDPARNSLTERQLPDEVSLALPRTHTGRVVTQVDRVLVDDGDLQHLCRIDEDNPHTRLNDGCCDALGRLWVGTYSARGEPEAGLYLVDIDGTVRRVLDGMVAANGLAWTGDGTALYLVDTGRSRIDVYRPGDDGATLIHDRLLAEHVGPGRPDGLAVDVEGGIWVALWGGAEIRRYDPDGCVSERVAVPVTYPTSVAFGGNDLRTLFITTARRHLDDPDSEPWAGSVLGCDPGVGGITLRRFAG